MLYKSILFKCLDFEIKRKDVLTKLKDQYIKKVGYFINLVTWLDFKILLSKLTRSYDYKLRTFKDTDARKLQNLRVSSQGGIRACNVIFFSYRTFINVEEDVLKLGLQFGLPVSRPKFTLLFLCV